MIELRNITKSYSVRGGRHFVLKNVSLTLPRGTNIAVLGPNGAGKSTILKLISGVESADSGEIISDMNLSWPLGLSQGFQGSLTGRQNAEFVCDINGLRREQVRQVITFVQDFAEIGKYFEMPVKTYSSGMKARLTFGMSMCFQFEAYLIDELTAVGDRGFKKKAQAAFDKLKKDSQLIYVSHSIETLKQSCDSALFLHDATAEFYPDIDDGINAYIEYINAKRAAKRMRKRRLPKYSETTTLSATDSAS